MVKCEQHKWHCAGWYTGDWQFSDPRTEPYSTDKRKSVTENTVPPYIYCKVCGESPLWYQHMLYDAIMSAVL